MEGYFQRIWKKFSANKVMLLKKGIYIVRFLAIESRNKVIQGHYFFDSKPLLMVKCCDSAMDVEKEEARSHPC